MTYAYPIELHAHPKEGTLDATATAGEMVASAHRKGLAGLCVIAQVIPDELRLRPDFPSLTQDAVAMEVRRAFDEARRVAANLPNPPQVYFGAEYRVPKTTDDLLVFGLEPEVLAGVDLARIDPWNLRQFVVDRGGLICAAHPFRHRKHGAPFGGQNLIDAVEVYNGQLRYLNRNGLAASWCERIDRLPLVGSDAYGVDEIGEAVVVLKTLPASCRQLGQVLRGEAPSLYRRALLRTGLQTSRYNGLMLEDELRHTERLGQRMLEIFFDGFSPRDIDLRARERLLAMASGMGIAIAVHAPLKKLEDAEGEALDLIRFAADVGAGLVVIPALALTSSAQLSTIAGECKGTPITVALNNAAIDGRSSPPETLLETVFATPDVQVALDVGAAHIHSGALDYVSSILAGLKGTDRVVTHLQLHDNDGRVDDHLNIGQGSVPVRMLLERLFAAGFDGSGVIAHWRDPYRDITQLVEIINTIDRPRVAV